MQTARALALVEEAQFTGASPGNEISNFYTRVLSFLAWIPADLSMSDIKARIFFLSQLWRNGMQMEWNQHAD